MQKVVDSCPVVCPPNCGDGDGDGLSLWRRGGGD